MLKYCYISGQIGSSITSCDDRPIKVGDRVRVHSSVSKPTYTWGPVTHKSIGTVISIHSKSMIYIKFPEQNNWKGAPSEMEVVP